MSRAILGRLDVSIHALLTECDQPMLITICPCTRFNPRTPYGVRQLVFAAAYKLQQFQSTHSLRSATNGSFTLTAAPNVSIHALLTECDTGAAGGPGDGEGFNPRTPYGVRREEPSAGFRSTRVSIHALLTECDSRKTSPSMELLIGFQSTHSLRSATIVVAAVIHFELVSIHALLTECDMIAAPSERQAMVSIHALLTECDLQ